MEHDIPLMGINLGTMGFLTEEEPEHLTECLQAILKHEYNIEERFLLEVKIPSTGEKFYALNDAVITRGGFARLIQVECTVNGERYGTFYCGRNDRRHTDGIYRIFTFRRRADRPARYELHRTDTGVRTQPSDMSVYRFRSVRNPFPP